MLKECRLSDVDSKASKADARGAVTFPNSLLTPSRMTAALARVKLVDCEAPIRGLASRTIPVHCAWRALSSASCWES
jgi:hypothetical protein